MQARKEVVELLRISKIIAEKLRRLLEALDKLIYRWWVLNNCLIQWIFQKLFGDTKQVHNQLGTFFENQGDYYLAEPFSLEA